MQNFPNTFSFFSIANLCQVVAENNQIISRQRVNVLPHHSSMFCDRINGRCRIDPELFKVGAEWLIHGQMTRVANITLIRNITLIPKIDIALFAGVESTLNLIAENPEEVAFVIDENISLTLGKVEAELLFKLRSAFSSIFKRFLENHHSYKPTDYEKRVLDVVASVVAIEDKIEEKINLEKFNALK